LACNNTRSRCLSVDSSSILGRGSVGDRFDSLETTTSHSSRTLNSVALTRAAVALFCCVDVSRGPAADAAAAQVFAMVLSKSWSMYMVFTAVPGRGLQYSCMRLQAASKNE
jgi:hypothetical protein